jgi:tripartite-type tricarboxylate transporter receptor subunit TctC
LNIGRVTNASTTLALPVAALAQAYPDKPIRVIVAFSPGSTNDMLARIVATHMSENMGETMVVDNRMGFQGILGTDLAARSEPDGYTLVVISSAYTMNPVVYKMPYDTLTALAFVARIGASFLALTVNPSSPYNTVSELVAAAKSTPGS